MDGVFDKTALFNPEVLSALQKMHESFGDKYFDAWDFACAVNPVLGLPLQRNPQYMGRVKFSEIDCPSKLWMVRLSEIVNVSPNLVQQKVLADVLHGAEHNKAWKDWVKIAEMDEPKDSVPTISEDDFIIVEGAMSTKARYAGGKFGSVSLDCSEDKGLHRVVLGIKKTWIKDSKWNAIQEAVTVAGAAMYKHVASDLCTKLGSAAGGTESFDTDLYKTIVKAISTNKSAGFPPDAILINPAQEATLMAMDKFISVEMLGRVGKLAEKGEIGYFYGNIPVYSTSVCGANPIVYSTQKGVVMGLRQDLQIEDYDDPIEGLEGAVLTMRFDLATAFSAAIRKVATS
jgi:hypothetical protein